MWDSSVGGLYLTDVADRRSVRLETLQGGSGGGTVAPQFQLASSDGSRVCFSDPQQLVNGAGTGDLYECEIGFEAASPRGVLTDVAPGAAVVGGVLGVSADGSSVFFAANGVLAPGAVHGNCQQDASTAGEECNLYVRHAG